MQVQKGKRLKPLALLFHAPHGLGKTNLPLESYKPVYVGSEENDEIESDRLPKITDWYLNTGKKEIDQYGFVNQLKWLRDNDHDYKTLVIDTMDALEQVAQKAILVGDNAKKTMATAFGGYGKAFQKMADMFLAVRDEYLVPLRDRKGMNIIILCHSDKKKHEDPMTNTSYDHYETSLHKQVKPIFEDWVSGIFFINYQLFKAEADDGRTHAVGTGKRVIYTEERPSHVAKNRFNLPYEIDYDKNGTWGKIGKMIKDYFGTAPKFEAPKELPPVTETTPEPAPTEAPAQSEAPAEAPKMNDDEKHQVIQVMKAIDELFPKLDPSLSGGITTAIQRAGSNLQELNRIYTKMQNLAK